MRSRGPRAYAYQGPEALRREAERQLTGTTIRSLADLRTWLEGHPDAVTEAATFVVMTDGTLRLAARRTEHVACAQGARVLAAGEIRFTRAEVLPQVLEITNQSTGYCPEPASWPAVAAALSAIGLAAPDGYTQEFVFRRCPQCDQLNVVKSDWFYCGACDAALPRAWNFDREPEGS